MKLNKTEAYFFIKAKQYVGLVRDGRLSDELFGELADAYDDAQQSMIDEIDGHVDRPVVPVKKDAA